MTRALAALLLLSTVARADTSVALPGADFDPKKCSMNDSPYRRAWESRRFGGIPPLRLMQAPGRHHILVSDGTRNVMESVAIDQRTGARVMQIPVENAALVEDAAGELVGMLEIRREAPSTLRLTMHGGGRWTARTDGWGDSATTLVAGDLLVVALFHRIATGASLIALDLHTGERRWTADVVQMRVGHSKYFNDVSLERRGDAIVMRGFEAFGCYEQRFELGTGRRLSSSLRP
jgi:hypothetical protein